MPHHGSSRNVDEAFFARVTADHYVFSADGRHGNPDPQTLRMLAAARGTDEYTLHFTLPEDFREAAADHSRGPQPGGRRDLAVAGAPPGLSRSVPAQDRASPCGWTWVTRPWWYPPDPDPDAGRNHPG